MNPKFLLSPALAAAALLGLTLIDASGIQYTISGAPFVEGNDLDPGLVVTTEPLLAKKTFWLNNGGSVTFDLFKIWTTEDSVNSDDKARMPISATLYFETPTVDATMNGFTFGGSTLYGASQWGELDWTDNLKIFTVGDTTFSVALNDVKFNKGLGGLWNGAATVKATVTQIPDNGSTAMLLGLALLALAFVRRRSAIV